MANPTTKPDKRTYRLNNSRASCLIAQSKWLRGYEAMQAEIPHLRNVIAVGVIDEVTGFGIVPTVMAILLQTDLTKYELSQLRYFSNTGAAFPIESVLKLRKAI